MSSALALADVTTAIVALLRKGSSAFDQWKGHLEPTPTKSFLVKALSPKAAEKAGEQGNLANVLLYRTGINGAWRNQPLSDGRRSDTGHAPLALDLNYLVSAYGEGGEEGASQLILAIAMQTLHDHPVLIKEDLQPLKSGLDEQFEQIKISLRPLTDDELNKIWTPLGVPYRLSAAYDVSAVLIDSRKPVVRPLPVLRRGRPVEEDLSAPSDGALEQARKVEHINLNVDLIGTLPTLRRVELPLPNQRDARLGDLIVFHGVNLGPDRIPALHLVLEHSRGIAQPFSVPIADRARTSITFRLPSVEPPGAPLPSGSWTAHVAQFEAGAPPDRPYSSRTNALPLALAPIISDLQVVDVLPDDEDDPPPKKAIQIECRPSVLAEQRVALLAGSRELSPSERPSNQSTSTLEFQFDESQLPSGTYRIRLRVDGIDSFVIDFSKQPPQFDSAQVAKVEW